MEEYNIYKDLGPYSLPLTEIVSYLSIQTVSEETSRCVCAYASYDHVEEVIGDYVVLELHMEIQVVIRVSCWKLNLLLKVTVIGAV